MTPEEQKALHYHAQEIAKILHKNAALEVIENLEGIEKTVRGQILEHVSPQIAPRDFSDKVGQPTSALMSKHTKRGWV